MKQLPNGVANGLSRDAKLRFAAVCHAVLLQPVMHERFNVSREFVPVVGSGCARKLSKSDEDGNPEEHIPRRIVVLR